MGQIDKLKRITKARIEAFLDSLEKPEIIFPQLIKELSEKVKLAAGAEAKALSVVKADQRRLDEANGMVLRFEKGAALAVKAEDTQTAKQAISAQIEAEKKVDIYKKALAQSESAYNAAKHVRIQLTENLKELKIRKKEILHRHRQAQLHKEIINKHQIAPPASTKSILDAVANMEAKIEMQESVIEVQNEIAKTLGSSFDTERIDILENEAEVKKRLDALKLGFKANNENA